MTNKSSILVLVMSLLATVVSAQRPYEFKCRDYIATPDRSQDKFSYDEANNTFTINDTGTNNIAFQMDKKADYAYYITNEQTWFAVKGTNLNTSTANSDIWWFNGFNDGGSTEANHAVTAADGEQVVVWNIKGSSKLNANMNYDNEQIYISSQGNQFSHSMGLTSTKGTSTISMIGYFAPYELAATYPELMVRIGYSADGKSLTAELKDKISALIAIEDLKEMYKIDIINDAMYDLPSREQHTSMPKYSNNSTERTSGNYKKKEQVRQLELMKNTTLFHGDCGGGEFLNKTWEFCLSDSRNNIFEDIVEDCIDYFKNEQIVFWGSNGIPNHILSSQVACLNHLFAIRNDRDLVLKLAQMLVGHEVEDVEPVECDKSRPYIAFEVTSSVNDNAKVYQIII